MMLLALAFTLAVLVGALSGVLTARWLLRRSEKQPPVQAKEPDPWVAAEIDQAAASWAMAQGRPEAAPVMADKLHLLHHLGQRRGWRQ
jgi:hypothetical protein